MTSFDIHCDLPLEAGAFAASPDARGTLNIIWSCFSLLVLCTWSILYLNVPLQTNCHNRRERYLRSANRTFWKVAWMLLNVLAPEWALGKAWADYRSVLGTQRAFEEHKKIADRDVPWKLLHTSFANLGGFTVVFDDSTPAPSEDNTATTKDELATAPSGQPPTATSAVAATDIVAGSDKQGTDEECQKALAREPVEAITTAATADVPTRGSPDPGRQQTDEDAMPGISGSGGAKDMDVEAGQQPVDMRQDQSTDARPPTAATTPPRISGDTESTSRSRIGSLSRFVQSSHFPFRPYSAMGAVLFASDDSNMDAAVGAVQNAKLLTTAWERDRFLRLSKSWRMNLRALQSNHWVLDANQLLLARRLGIIDQLPCLAEDDIEDRSKDDLATKAITAGQLLWFVLDLAVRLAQGVPTTLLEVMTLSFCVCSAATYLLLTLAHKPKGVQSSLCIPAARRASPAELLRLAVHGPSLYLVRHRGDVSIPNNALHADLSLPATENDALYLVTGASAGLVVFGSLHCLAWNFAFPTRVERVLWQTGSLFTAGAFPALWLLYNVYVVVCFLASCGRKAILDVPARPPRIVAVASRQLLAATGALFAAARLFVLIEVFRSLAFLPPRAFAATAWPVSLPHIG